MSTQKQVYRGFLRKGSNGEEDDILFLVPDSGDATEIYVREDRDGKILAEQIEEDIDSYGRYLTVRYFISDKEASEHELTHDLIKKVSGMGDVQYGTVYSEMTGYLYTNEDINVGGDDLLLELKSFYGRFCHLEIEYSKDTVAESRENFRHDAGCRCPTHFQGVSGPVPVYHEGHIGITGREWPKCEHCGIPANEHTDKKCLDVVRQERQYLLGTLEKAAHLLSETTQAIQGMIKWAMEHEGHKEKGKEEKTP